MNSNIIKQKIQLRRVLTDVWADMKDLEFNNM